MNETLETNKLITFKKIIKYQILLGSIKRLEQGSEESQTPSLRKHEPQKYSEIGDLFVRTIGSGGEGKRWLGGAEGTGEGGSGWPSDRRTGASAKACRQPHRWGPMP